MNKIMNLVGSYANPTWASLAIHQKIRAEVTRMEQELADYNNMVNGAGILIGELRAKLAALEAQESVATVIKHANDRHFMSERLGYLPDGTYKLYLAAGAKEKP